MSDLILHHFDSSPFAEKVRLIFGIKQLDWCSVQIPMVMPKPDLTALTGGYRKTPVLQIGADIYCDTQLIAREIDRRYPAPTLFPDGSEGLCMALAHWSDVNFFQAGAALSMGLNTEIPDAVLQDRKAFFNFMDFSTLAEQIPQFRGYFNAHLDQLEQMLSHQYAFLLGDTISWADVLAYFPVWMARGNLPHVAAELLEPLRQVQVWEQRLQSIGHGQAKAIAAADALAIARQTEITAQPHIDQNDPLKLSAQQAIRVISTDYGGVAVTGRLHSLTRREVVLCREDDRAGQVLVHFPRLGFNIEAV